jgi:hypothetical protein
MKRDIENIVTKHLKFVACMTALFLYEGWLGPWIYYIKAPNFLLDFFACFSRIVLSSFCANCLNKKPEHSEYNNLQLQFKAIVMMVAFLY